MKLKEFKFNSLKSGNPDKNNAVGLIGLAVFDGETQYEGFIGEILKQISHLAEREISETNWYFNTFIIRLKTI